MALTGSNWEHQLSGGTRADTTLETILNVIEFPVLATNVHTVF